MNFSTRFKKIPSLFTKEQFKKLLSLKFWCQLIKTHKKQIFIGLGIILFILLLIPIVTYISFAGDLKDKQSITNRNKTGLTLTDADGKPFFTFFHAKSVTYIPLSEMPEPLQEAVIASEDQDFYKNPGFSITGMTRAFVRNFMAGQIVEGGSTISQELVKIALLNSERNYLRKYQELVLATELNRRFSKQDILEMYLNSVYFGEGAFGIENAAQVYFGIHAKELSVAESAMLVGLLPAPSAYSPFQNETLAIRRQQTVLNLMMHEKYLTEDQAGQAANEKLVYNTSDEEASSILAPHFAIYVKNLLSEKYGEERIIRDGFVVKTTLNSAWQKYAEQVVKNQILTLQRNKATNGAVIAIDPKTGDIKVMVGSHDWTDEDNGKINMSIRARQPGSSFKPLIYADALEKKVITPASTLHDDPISYGNYKPLDYDKKFRGPVTTRYALANSLNIPAVEVLNMLGVSEGIAMARKFGITTLTKEPTFYGLPLVLGGGEVPLIEMTNAYAVFADQGTYHSPNAILEIKNKYDHVVTDQPTGFLATFFNFFNVASIIKPFDARETRVVMSDETAYLISSILSDNKARADVFGGSLTLSRPAAVKTGTTNDYKDALTIGYTPSIVVGVWVGNNDNTQMDNIAGSSGAAPIWRLLMENFFRGKPLEPFLQPSAIVKREWCVPPTQLSDAKQRIASFSGTEYFIRGTEPDKCPTPTPTASPSETPTPDASPSPTNAQSAPTTMPTQTPITPTQTPATPTPTGIVLPTLITTPTPTL